MAVDDIITNSVSVVSGTPSDFQPASGVEIILTCVSSNSSAVQCSCYDGTLTNIFMSGATSGVTYTGNDMKMGITNTDYLRMVSTSGTIQIAYSGIQTK